MHKGPEAAKKASADAAYQDSVTAPLSRAHDEDVTGMQDEEDKTSAIHPWASESASGQLQEVLTAVEKVNPVL